MTLTERKYFAGLWSGSSSFSVLHHSSKLATEQKVDIRDHMTPRPSYVDCISFDVDRNFDKEKFKTMSIEQTAKESFLKTRRARQGQ